MSDQPTPEERRFRALAGSAADRIVELAPDGTIVFANEVRMSKDLRLLGSLGAVHPDDRAEVIDRFRDAFAGEGSSISFRVCDEERGTIWVESTLSPFEAESGERHVLVASRDVTEARQLEQTLRESQERLRLIAENAYDMILEIDEDGNLLYANDRVEDTVGLSGQQLLTVEVHPEDCEERTRAFAAVFAGEQTTSAATYRVRHRDGHWCWVDVTVIASPQPDGRRNRLAIARDVTDRVEAEQRLRESEQRHRELVENAPLGIFVVRDEVIVYANPAAAALCGAQNGPALCGTRMGALFDPDAVREVTSLLSQQPADSRRAQIFDLHVAGLDGVARHLLGVGNLTPYDGRPAFQAILRDVTELEDSRREQERLALQLQEARKLESLGVLAGGIAHDFNNLLAVILSSVRYAKSSDATPAHRDEALADAIEAADSAARLVKQLLAYAGRRSPEVRGLDLSELAGSLSELLATALPGGVELVLEASPEPLPVHADLVQLEQVLMNLVLNAADSVGTGPGRVTVRTFRRPLQPSELLGWLGGESLGGGDYACLEVEDTGRGMDAETRARIFEPFFTTKKEGHGLGLSAVLGLVQGHRGAIDVDSEPGSGTRFRIALPMERPRTARAASDCLVLLADPHRERCRTSAAALRGAGRQVVEACDLDQALDLWTLHGEEIDAAVIDADLPSSGAEPLVDLLRSARPELPIVVQVESAESGIGGGSPPEPALLAKPFSVHQLIDRLADVLAKRSVG